MVFCTRLYFLVCFLEVYGRKQAPTPYIMGGVSVTSPTTFPYQVSLRSLSNNSHFCGGSIINRNWVLTAGHCMDNQTIVGTISFYVVAGAIFLSTGGSEYKVSSVTLHPKFSGTLNDIAVAKVSTPFAYSSTIQQISLASSVPPQASAAVLSGWGRISNTDLSSPNQLRYINLLIIPFNDCVKIYKANGKEIVTENNICTLNDAGQGGCAGDSGGALVYKGTQIGLLSFGPRLDRCGVNTPDVFASVPTFKSWISTATGVMF